MDYRFANQRVQAMFSTRALTFAYNDEMCLKVALSSFVKSLIVAIILWGGCLLTPRSAMAQRVFIQDLGTSRQPADASKPTLPAALTPSVSRGATPTPPPAHIFWDRTNLALFSGIAVTRGIDYASTRNFQARGRQEILIPDDVVNNSAGFASLEAAGTVASVGVSYLLHRMGHHKLERWMSIGHIGVTAFGDVRNYALESKHRVGSGHP
jgi:hypothetical protein